MTRRQGSFDLFEGVMLVLGLLFLALAGVCLYATVYLIVHFGDADPRFPAGQDFQQVIKGVGIGLFVTATIVTFGVASHLLGDRLPRGLRARFRRRR
jgi:hypothetical protein